MAEVNWSSKKVDPLVWAERFGLHQYRCNAPPVQPFDNNKYPDAENEVETYLKEVFEPGGWRIDSGLPRTSVNHKAIMASLTQQGEDSPYATVKHQQTGLTCLHAAAINGFEEIFYALVEKGKMKPSDPVDKLAKIVSTRHEMVRGADAMWILKRRGHKKFLGEVCKLPEMVEQLELVKKEVDKAKNIRKKQVAAYKKKLEEEEKARKEAEEKARREEEARREREEQQRAFRKKIIEYTHDLKDLMGMCEAGKWQEWDIGRKGALKELDKVKSDVETEVKRIASYHKTSVAMEVERDMNRPQAVVDQMVQLLADYEAMWECVGRFEEFKADVEGRSWHGDLNPTTLEEEIRAMMTDIKKQAKSTKKSAAFKGLDAEVKDLFNANPVIAALHADFMRTRHWE
jgi:hypothetical protein